MQINYQMKIAICDDDPRDRHNMLSLVLEYLDMHNYHVRVDEFHTGESFLETDLTGYDLVILDIFMGELNGIQTAKQIIVEHPGMQIIFCSSSNAYAEESYDVVALRYLTKPVEKEKLFRTLDRYFHVKTSLRTLTYKQDRLEEHVFLSEVLWIEADGHRCIIHTRKGDRTTRTTLSQLAEQLEGADFVRPIRYALVSLSAVAAIPTDVLVLSDGSSIPISRQLRPEMKKAYTDYKMRTMLQRGGVH